MRRSCTSHGSHMHQKGEACEHENEKRRLAGGHQNAGSTQVVRSGARMAYVLTYVIRSHVLRSEATYCDQKPGLVRTHHTVFNPGSFSEMPQYPTLRPEHCGLPLKLSVTQRWTGARLGREKCYLTSPTPNAAAMTDAPYVTLASSSLRRAPEDRRRLRDSSVVCGDDAAAWCRKSTCKTRHISLQHSAKGSPSTRSACLEDEGCEDGSSNISTSLLSSPVSRDVPLLRRLHVASAERKGLKGMRWLGAVAQ